MKFARVSRLSGVRTTSGRPSVSPAIGSPGEVVVGEQVAGVRLALEGLAEQASNTSSALERLAGDVGEPREQPAQAASSLAPLLQCTIATGRLPAS